MPDPSPALALRLPWVVVAAAALGVLTMALSGPVLRRLPQGAPATGSGTERPPRYADLAGRGFGLTCGGLTLGASLLALLLAPAPWLPLWLVWSTLMVLLVTIDGATTWLPLRLTQTSWAAGALGTVPALTLTLLGSLAPSAVLRVLLGAACSGVFYLVLWRLGHGLGFGDVRLSPLLGALGASLSWTGWWLTLLAGALVGVLWGAVRAAAGRRGPYAYAPSLWIGPAAALVAQTAGPIGA